VTPVSPSALRSAGGRRPAGQDVCAGDEVVHAQVAGLELEVGLDVGHEFVFGNSPAGLMWDQDTSRRMLVVTASTANTSV